MDALSSTAIVFGVILLISSWIYLMIIAFQADFTWGLVSVFVPLLAYIYAIKDWQKGKETIYLAVIGWALVAFGAT